MTVHAPGVLADLVDRGGIGVAVLDGKRRYRYVNPCLAKLAGRPVTEHIGRTMREVLPEFAHLIEPAVDRVSRGDSDVAVTIRASASAGTPAEWEATYVAITLEGGERGVGILIMDVTDRQMAAAETRRRLQQQAALATLGQLALGPASLDEVLQAATDMLARELGADFAGVLAFTPERDHLWMRAGTGFRDEAVGRMTAAVGVDSQAGYTVLCNDAVLTPDTTREDRFTVSQNLLDLGVRSAISVPIPGTDEAFGVLGVLSGQPACFDQDDANMLRATANVLGATVVRDAQAQALQELAAQRGRLVAQALDAAESEQRRVADVLHDDVLQHLLFARLELRGMDIAPELANRLQRSIEEATTLLRQVIGGLHPITLSHAGLPGAI